MADVNVALIQANKGKNKKDDMMLLLSPDNNWERFLTPAPYTISLLGTLMMIPGDRDFSLVENAPREGFRYLRHPSSFKACLVQVSNEGWSAFNEAHTNMDQIRLHSANVETHVKSAVKILLGGTKEDVADVLPVCLGRVSSIADTCKTLATGTEKKFIRVMEVIEELLEVCTASKGSYDKKYRETVVSLNFVKQQKEEVQNSRDEMKERSTKLREDMERAQQDFKMAMDGIPSGGRMLAFSIAEGAIDCVKGLCSIFTPLFRSRPVFHSQSTSSCLERETGTTTREKSLDEIRAYNEVFRLRNWLDELTKIATSELRRNEPYPSLNAIKEGRVAYLRLHFDRLNSHWQQSPTGTSSEKTIMKLCEQGSNICKRLESLVETFEDDADGKNGREIAKDAKALLEKATQLQAKAKLHSSTSPIDEQSPNMRKLATQVQSEGVLSGINENARYKIEIAKQILNEARDRHERSYQEMRKENERLQQLIKEMASLDPQKIDFEVIKSTLTKGITTLANVREQWTKFVAFFEAISNLIQCSLSTSLEYFVSITDNKRKTVIDGSSVSNIFRDMLINQAVQANCIAFSVHSIATSYVLVSGKHIMPQISGLSKLIAVDHEGGDAVSAKQNLQSATEEAQKEIKGLIENQRSEFKSRIDTRERIFRQEVESILPRVSEFELHQIRETVSAGMTKSDEELNKEVDDLV